MASPILLSQPSPSLSLLGILRGFQLGILGVYRGLQNSNLTQTHSELLTVFKEIFRDTIFIQCVVYTPIIFFTIIFRAMEYISGNPHMFLMQFVYLIIYRVLNLNLLMVVFTKISNQEMCDLLIKRSLEFFNPKYAKVMDLDRETLDYTSNYITTFSMVQKLMTYFKNFLPIDSLTHFQSYLKRYVSLIFYNCFVCSILYLPEKIGTCIVVLLVFQNLINVIDFTSAVTFTLIISKLPFDYSISVILCITECHIYMYDLLLPYFSKVKFTNSERTAWIRSREGVLFGFTLCFYLSILKMPLAGVIIIRLSEVSLGYLLTKISDPSPENSTQLINWSSSQIVWNQEASEKVLNAEFINDTGFKQFPASFLWNTIG